MRRAVVVLVAVCAPLLAVASPVGAADATPQCRVDRAAETRPMNAQANATVPRKGVDYSPNTPWPTWAFDDSSNRRRVDGDRRGTTDELIQWAACKWQLPVDVLRAVAAQESWWDVNTLGDNGASRGLMQIKIGAATHVGVTATAAKATAWSLDYYGATLRACLDGHFVLWRDQRASTTRAYTRGDLWGCVEAWYSGIGPTTWSSWYTTRVQQYLAEKRWNSSDFLAWKGWADWCRKATPAEAAGYWNCSAA